ncbi:MAG: hypothetical protein NUV61_02150 [Candidatus Azambacteria bacterium]|nr:hypothetical protein [Candidatus Azambacteria bacterium]
MAQIIFFISIVALVVLSAGTVVVVFHFFQYRLKKDKHRRMIALFLVGSLLLFFLELVMLLGADWSAINEVIGEYFFKNSL